MAKIVCKTCGHKNPSSAVACANCGNFLIDEPAQPPKATVQTHQEENTTQFNEQAQEIAQTQPYTGQGRVDTITVGGGNTSQWIGMLISFGVFAVFLTLDFLVPTLPSYSIYIFLVLIFIMPSLLRSKSSSVRFTREGFMFPKGSSQEMFAFDSIENVQIGEYNRTDQSLTLNFKQERPPVRVDFKSMMTFRNLVMMLNRRRIPVISNRQPGADTAQATN